MKRTEKEIYDFVVGKLRGLKESFFPQDMQTTIYIQGLEEAYHEVLDFIGTVRVEEMSKDTLVFDKDKLCDVIDKHHEKGETVLFVKSRWEENKDGEE